jgi:hypothetical protein
VLFIITGTICTFVKCVNDPLLEHFIDKELCPLEEPLPPKPFKINKKNLELCPYIGKLCSQRSTSTKNTHICKRLNNQILEEKR